MQKPIKNQNIGTKKCPEYQERSKGEGMSNLYRVQGKQTQSMNVKKMGFTARNQQQTKHN